jgi:hypothetical protein
MLRDVTIVLRIRKYVGLMVIVMTLMDGDNAEIFIVSLKVSSSVSVLMIVMKMLEL